MSNTSRRTFVCPECNEQIPVTGPTEEALLRSGCPRCTASVSPENFAAE